MADKMAISIKDTEKVWRNEYFETDGYIESLEEQLESYQ